MNNIGGHSLVLRSKVFEAQNSTEIDSGHLLYWCEWDCDSFGDRIQPKIQLHKIAYKSKSQKGSRNSSDINSEWHECLTLNKGWLYGQFQTFLTVLLAFWQWSNWRTCCFLYACHACCSPIILSSFLHAPDHHAIASGVPDAILLHQLNLVYLWIWSSNATIVRQLLYQSNSLNIQNTFTFSFPLFRWQYCIPYLIFFS